MVDKELTVEVLLDQMKKEGLPVQRGGFSVESIPTGISSFDWSTGIGGVPRRRVTLFEGEESSGKTLLLLVLIARVQEQGGEAAFVDLEHALTPSFARLLGVDYDSLVISRPRTLNEAYDVAKTLAGSGLFDVVGFDSAVALATVDDLKKSAKDGSMRAGQAQVHSEEMKKIVSILHDRTAFVMINQIREDPNPPSWYRGKRLYAPGGRALRHYASMRVKVRATETYKNSKGQKVGHRVQTQVTKNKVAQPFRTAEFDLRYDTGLDLVSDLIDTAIRSGIIEQSSSWFTINVIDMDTAEITREIKKNGREAIEAVIRSDPEIRRNLKDQILGSGVIGEEEDDGEEDEKESSWSNVD